MKGILLLKNQREAMMPATTLASPPMLNFFDKPLLDIPIRLLKKNKVSEVTLATEAPLPDLTGYLSQIPYENSDIRCATIENRKFSFQLSEEDETGFLFPNLPVSDMDFSEAIRFHQNHQHLITAILPAAEKEITPLEETTIEEFCCRYSPENYCYLLRAPYRYLLTTSENERFPVLLPPDTKIAVCYLTGYWKTVTTLESYLTVLKESLENEWLMSPYQSNNGVILNRNTFLEVGAKIKPPVYIGENVTIKKNAEILPYSILCRHCTIGENTKISDSIILEGCQIQKNAVIFGTILGNHCTVTENTVVGEGSRYGAYSRVLHDTTPTETDFSSAVISDGFAITEQPIAIPKENSHNFFISLGNACRQIFGSGTLGIFRDDGISSELATHSLQAGLQTCGINLYQFPECTLAMAKSACPFYHLKAGLYLYEEKQKVFLAIFDANGHFISSELQNALNTAMKEPAQLTPPTIHKTTAVKPYQLYYYTKITRNLGYQPAECYLTLKASPLIQEYARKIATCHRITLLTEERPDVIQFETNSAGTDFTIWDEKGHPLTKRQIEALIAQLVIADGESDFVTTARTSETIRKTLLKHRVNLLETKNTPHSIDVALSRLPNQHMLIYDPVYLVFRILLYLSEHRLTLAQWIAGLPKSFFIEKSITCAEQLNDALEKLLMLAKNNYTKENGHYKIKSKKGITLISPEQNRIRIISESEREEYAKELTDFFVAHCKKTNDIF